jgi:hypothetical protein
MSRHVRVYVLTWHPVASLLRAEHGGFPSRVERTVLSQITENRKVGARKPLIFCKLAH